MYYDFRTRAISKVGSIKISIGRLRVVARVPQPVAVSARGGSCAEDEEVGDLRRWTVAGGQAKFSPSILEEFYGVGTQTLLDVLSKVLPGGRSLSVSLKAFVPQAGKSGTRMFEVGKLRIVYFIFIRLVFHHTWTHISSCYLMLQ